MYSRVCIIRYLSLNVHENGKSLFPIAWTCKNINSNVKLSFITIKACRINKCCSIVLECKKCYILFVYYLRMKYILVLCCVVLCCETCVALCCVALRCVALRCVALCCVVLYYEEALY